MRTDGGDRWGRDPAQDADDPYAVRDMDTPGPTPPTAEPYSAERYPPEQPSAGQYPPEPSGEPDWTPHATYPNGPMRALVPVVIGAVPAGAILSTGVAQGDLNLTILVIALGIVLGAAVFGICAVLMSVSFTPAGIVVRNLSAIHYVPWSEVWRFDLHHGQLALVATGGPIPLHCYGFQTVTRHLGVGILGRPPMFVVPAGKIAFDHTLEKLQHELHRWRPRQQALPLGPDPSADQAPGNGGDQQGWDQQSWDHGGGANRRTS